MIAIKLSYFWYFSKKYLLVSHSIIPYKLVQLFIPLLLTFLQFCSFKFATSSDMSKMLFRDLHRFVRRKDISEPLSDYNHKSIFWSGSTCICTNQTLEDYYRFEDEFPLAKQHIANCYCVDRLICFNNKWGICTSQM